MSPWTSMVSTLLGEPTALPDAPVVTRNLTADRPARGVPVGLRPRTYTADEADIVIAEARRRLRNPRGLKSRPAEPGGEVSAAEAASPVTDLHHTRGDSGPPQLFNPDPKGSAAAP